MKTVLAGIVFLALASVASAQVEVRTGDSKTTTHQAVLTWTIPATCTDGSPCTPVTQTVYRMVGTCAGATPPTGFTKLASVSATTKTYTDTNLAAATSYCYYVTASAAQPPAWDSTVTYTGGQEVTYNSQVYVALNNTATNLNQNPATATSFWALASVESWPSNVAGGATGPTGAPTAPTSFTASVQ